MAGGTFSESPRKSIAPHGEKGQEIIMARKIISFLLSVLVSGFIGYQVAWNPGFMTNVSKAGLSLLSIVILAGGAAVLFYIVRNPSKWGTALACALGVIAAFFMVRIFNNISWMSTIYLATAAGLLLLLGYFTTVDVLWWNKPQKNPQQRIQPRASNDPKEEK